MNFLIANRGYAMEIASETDAFPSSKHRNLCPGMSDTCSAAWDLGVRRNASVAVVGISSSGSTTTLLSTGNPPPDSSLYCGPLATANTVAESPHKQLLVMQPGQRTLIY